MVLGDLERLLGALLCAPLRWKVLFLDGYWVRISCARCMTVWNTKVTTFRIRFADCLKIMSKTFLMVSFIELDLNKIFYVLPFADGAW